MRTSRSDVPYALALNDPAYPAGLHALRDAPRVVFTLGNRTLLQNPAAAVVGTRRATPYGLRVTRTLVTQLVQHGITIVSGMARGIDTAAHEAALDAGGSTIAVLGTGVDVVYPAGNTRVYERLLRQGLLLSEAPPGSRARRGSFPRRNRLIAALGKAVIVVEAPARSGALITAGVALEIGRDVGVVPGNVDVPASVGSNRLLRDGAAAILEPADALSLCGVTEALLPQAQRDPAALPNDAQHLWRVLGASGPLSPDALARAAGLDARQAGPALAALDIAGWVEIDHAGVVFAR
ncbi:MAG: DNA-processing protein DprA [Gemmatimonadaceae bacterium]